MPLSDIKHVLNEHTRTVASSVKNKWRTISSKTANVFWKLMRLPTSLKVLSTLAVLLLVSTVATYSIGGGSGSATIAYTVRMGELVGVWHENTHITNCSVGPAVHTKNGNGFLFAGHCGDANDDVTVGPENALEKVGSIADSLQHVDKGSYEDSAVVIAGNYTVSTKLGIGTYPFRTISVDELIERKGLGDVSICSDGAISGTRCGKFNGINTPTGLISAAFPSTGGDSGGPAYVVSNGRSELIGIVVRTYETVDGISGSLIAPLDHILERHPGMKIVLGKG